MRFSPTKKIYNDPKLYDDLIENKLLYNFKIANGCWVWQGTKNKEGYGRVKYRGRLWLAHRLSCIILDKNPLIGDVLDHMCNNPPCINPDHLRDTTQRENILRSNSIPARNARKIFCKRGHKLSKDNIYTTMNGRDCKECHRSRRKEKQ